MANGAFHHMSKKHMDKYCDEFSFRWTHRKMADDARTVAVLQGVAGKRLTYYQSSCSEVRKGGN